EAVHIFKCLINYNYIFTLDNANTKNIKSDSNSYRFQAIAFWPNKTISYNDQEYEKKLNENYKECKYFFLYFIPSKHSLNKKKKIPTKTITKKSLRNNDESWSCNLCTFLNDAEKYTCQMCAACRGSSTRKSLEPSKSQIHKLKLSDK
ncbi:hypothetical protein A3Q56_07568, partial [Intoshia linei]